MHGCVCTLHVYVHTSLRPRIWPKINIWSICMACGPIRVDESDKRSSFICVLARALTAGNISAMAALASQAARVILIRSNATAGETACRHARKHTACNHTHRRWCWFRRAMAFLQPVSFTLDGKVWDLRILYYQADIDVFGLQFRWTKWAFKWVLCNNSKCWTIISMDLME